ncbi:MAG: hypothetical protein RSC33_06135 [Vagococcus sp.]
MTQKKKKLIIISMCLLVIGLGIHFAIQSKNTMKTVEIHFDDTKEFTQQELEDGAKTVISYFNYHYSDSVLHQIDYDEHFYQNDMSTRVTGTSRYSDLPKENVLILKTSYTTGKHVEGSIGPNSLVEGWQFVLTRTHKNGKWRVLDQGV